jgi:hypothetical protein
MTDATCKTNSSNNRPLIFVCGIDSLHKTVCISTTLTSNESKDTFAFILKNIRLIYGREWCSRVAVILSDGASEITGAIDHEIDIGNFNPRAKRFLCHYHAVNLKGQKDLTYLKDEHENRLKNLMYHLFYRGFRYLETPEESKIFFRSSYEFFEKEKNEGRLSEETHAKFVKFSDAVLGNSAYLSNVYSKDVFHLGTRTTGRNEAENSSAKATGVNPSTSLCRLAKIDVARNSNRNFESDLRIQRETLAKPKDSSGFDNIATQITRHAWGLLQSQLQLFEDYSVYINCLIPLQFIVISKRNKLKSEYHEMQEFLYNTEGCEPIAIMLPRFYRVRTITVVDGFLTCTCPFFASYGIPCRHMLAINKGVVSTQDIHIRWTTAYANGGFDELLKSIDFTMSPGALCRAEPGDFPSITENAACDREECDIPCDGEYEQVQNEENQGGNEDNPLSEIESNHIGRLRDNLRPNERYYAAVQTRIFNHFGDGKCKHIEH